jgi:hypothetical protein
VETAAPHEYVDEPIGIGQGTGAYTKLEPILDSAGRVVRIISVSQPRDRREDGTTTTEPGPA